MNRWQIPILKSILTRELTRALREEPRDYVWKYIDPEAEDAPLDHLYEPLDDNVSGPRRAIWRHVHDDISWRALTEL